MYAKDLTHRTCLTNDYSDTANGFDTWNYHCPSASIYYTEEGVEPEGF